MGKQLKHLPRAGYTIPEVATMLGIDARTVRAMVKRDDIPAARLGRTYLVPADFMRRLNKGVVEQWDAMAEGVDDGGQSATGIAEASQSDDSQGRGDDGAKG